MPAERNNLNLLSKAHYPYWRKEPLRFLDLDIQGHVNNLALAAIAENSRSMFLRDDVFPLLDREASMLVSVRLVLEFQREVNYPGELDVGTAVERMGSSSIEFSQGVFDGEHCAATAVAVLVHISKDSRRPVAWPAPIRAALSKWLPPAAS